MRYYLTKTPEILKPLARDLVWSIRTDEPTVYLTFDDGPTVSVTDEVLAILDSFNAKATFFCVGENVKNNPKLFSELLDRGHAVGNHTQYHVNGWKTSSRQYLKNVIEANHYIGSNLFRPPYGKITRQQVKQIKPRFKIIMWDVLSGDFDRNTTGQKCVNNVLNAAKPGSIIVFHDSLKAKEKVLFSLPIILGKLREKGFNFKRLNDGGTD